MECFLLGSGGMMPMPRRRLTSVLVRTDLHDYLFDAGEGIQVSFKELGLGIKRLSVVAITHLHADHCLGLPGLLMLRAQVEDPGPLVIIGPQGIRRFVQNVRSDLRTYIPYKMKFIEIKTDKQNSGTFFSNSSEHLSWAKLEHSVPCVGFRLQQKERPGRFHPDKALAAGVPEGPLWGKLQAGNPVVLDNGKKVFPSDVLGPPRRGRSMAYVVDTRPCKNMDGLTKDADIAFIEGMFLPEHLETAQEKGHMTVDEAALHGSRNGVKKLVLVHISPRYNDSQRSEIQSAARVQYQDAILGKDLASYTIPLPEE